MDIMFLLTGFIFAVIIPIINIGFLGVKGLVYSLIMIVFSILVLAYTILSFFKFKISKVDYLKSKAIVSWDNGTVESKKTTLPYLISLLLGLTLGVIVYFNGIGLINSILFSLAGAFTSLGWLIMGIKRYERKMQSTDSFLLSHMGIIYNGKIEVFNGYSKGITSAKQENDTLVITLMKNKKETELCFNIPEEKKVAVALFLKDLTDYFSGEGNENK